MGCLFGRYSLDKPGLILADQGATAADFRRKVAVPSFEPVEENVIPLVGDDWFADDLTAGVRRFLGAAVRQRRNWPPMSPGWRRPLAPTWSAI